MLELFKSKRKNPKDQDIDEYGNESESDDHLSQNAAAAE